MEERTHLLDVCRDTKRERGGDLVCDEVANVEGEGEEAREKDNLGRGSGGELVPSRVNLRNLASEQANKTDLQKRKRADLGEQVDFV